ncbi:MAG: radical SAM family heme chaperone HemW [Planctomycetes bacterium]|nr:radical SAM family heme chaperone HemW [Planctomycetota bacterium]MCC7172621.1 radical SAM family heme chaperone HemW [Planctomycetota bacterium]
MHSPFCRRRCSYCDFAIAILRSSSDVDRFLDGISLELEHFGDSLRPRTLYVGGGTPSRLAPADLREFFARLDRTIDRRSVLEFTVEANPEDVTPDRAVVLREAGVTRVSLGVQSLDPETLRQLGRRHTPEQVRHAVTLLRDAGIRSINVDLIFAVPGQTPSILDADLTKFIELPTHHVSAYNLTYEDRTPLRSLELLGRLTRQEPDSELVAFRLVHERLAEAGFAAYEISNYAKPGHQSLHNLTYWNNEEYLGVGPSAVSCVGHVRWRNEPDLDVWFSTLRQGLRPVADAESLAPDRFIGESFALALRTSRGVLLSRLERRARMPIDRERLDRIVRLMELRLLEREGPRIRLTPRGRELADCVAAELI